MGSHRQPETESPRTVSIGHSSVRAPSCRCQRQPTARWQNLSVPALGYGWITVLHGYPQLVRVLRSEEKLTQNHYRRGQVVAETTEHEWLWFTTLRDAKAFPAVLVRRLGHDRWKQENNGWNDLTQNWAFKHGFLHACRHRPQAVSPEGQRQPVANRGLAAVSLILLLAFTLCSAFIHGHSKMFRRYPMSTIEVARQLRLSVCKLPPNTRAPDAPVAPHPS